jgi:hypothetical protein
MNSLYLLYFLFVLMLIQLSYLMYNKDNQSIFVFAIIVFISYLVNSNMIFVLGVSIVSINLLRYLRISTVYEGMENQEEFTKLGCREFMDLVYKKINSADKSSIPKPASEFCDKIKTSYIDSETDCDFYKYYVSEFNLITDNTSIKWINENIYDSTKFEHIVCNGGICKRNLPESIQNDLKKINPPISSFNRENFEENNIHEDLSDPNHISNVMDRLQKNTPELVDSLKVLNTLDMDKVNSLINNLNSLAGTFKGITGSQSD